MRLLILGTEKGKEYILYKILLIGSKQDFHWRPICPRIYMFYKIWHRFTDYSRNLKFQVKNLKLLLSKEKSVGIFWGEGWGVGVVWQVHLLIWIEIIWDVKDEPLEMNPVYPGFCEFPFLSSPIIFSLPLGSSDGLISVEDIPFPSVIFLVTQGTLYYRCILFMCSLIEV